MMFSSTDLKYVNADIIVTIKLKEIDTTTIPLILVPAQIINIGAKAVFGKAFNTIKYGSSIFDNNPSKIGAKIHNVEIMSVDKIKDFCKEHDIHIGIITVPLKYAQETADILIESGVKAIWNFAPTTLSVPNDILVQNENMASSLAILSRHLNLKMKK